MRLLDTETGQFVEKDPKTTLYGILSHTWDRNGEQTFEELKKIQQLYKLTSSVRVPEHPPEGTLARLLEIPSKAVRHAIWYNSKLSSKIRRACAVARKNGFRYIWIDSCCIDKSSSSELSEAINSMYKWYGLATVCYVYLVDVDSGKDPQDADSSFRRSRWFSRGWTLQELIAPVNVEFLSKNWAPIGSKHALAGLVASVTKIDYKALLHLKPLDAFSVAQRFSWIAERRTTREEDMAYSLLGIFDINMPTLYGEGDRAFRRLQEHIIQRIPDRTLFTWMAPEDFRVDTQHSRLLDLSTTNDTQAEHRGKLFTDPSFTNIFATSAPRSFKGCENVSNLRSDASHLPSSVFHLSEISYTPTPYGIRTKFQMVPLTQDLLVQVMPQSEGVHLSYSHSPNGAQWYLVILGCEHAPGAWDINFLIPKQLLHHRHQLGRLCYITRSKESGVEVLYAGIMQIWPRDNTAVGQAQTSKYFSCRPM